MTCAKCGKDNVIEQSGRLWCAICGEWTAIVLETEADTLEEARALVKEQSPAGVPVVEEKILSDGKPKISKGVANTTESAFANAQSEVPQGAELIDRREVVAWEMEQPTVVDAFSIDEAKSKLPVTVTVTRVEMTVSGKKGLFGIGKRPNRYLVRFYQPAIVEITYRQKARIRVAIGNREALAKKVKCERCGKSVEFILPVQLSVATTGESSAVLNVCSECMIKLSSGAAEISFAPSTPRPTANEEVRPFSSSAPRATADEEIRTLISELGRRDLLGPNPAIIELQEKGALAVPFLIKALDSNDVNAVVDAISLLQEMRAKEAIPKLSGLSKSKWAEVHQAAQIALTVFDKKPPAGLQFDSDQPYDQIAGLWTTIIQGRQMLYSPAELHSWCAQAIEALPSIHFSSIEKQAKAWGMTGSLVYKATHPDWPGGFDGTVPCDAARKCYEQAVRAEPNDSWWQDWVKRFS